jgi:hypothetical protein
MMGIAAPVCPSQVPGISCIFRVFSDKLPASGLMCDGISAEQI